MRAQFSLEKNNLIINFKENISSLTKIQLVSVYRLKKKNKTIIAYEKEFSIKEAIEIKSFLEQNEYKISASENLNKLFY